MKLLCIVTNGFEEIEAVGTIAILRRGNVDIDFAALHGSEATGRYGVTIKNLKKFDELKLEDYGMLFIAGGPEYVELESSKEFINVIKYFYETDRYIAAICAGPTLLGHLGYLKDKNYTCFNSMNEDFGGNFVDHYVVKDGKIITGKSAAATIDFAFEILETVKGKAQSEAIKEQIYYYHK